MLPGLLLLQKQPGAPVFLCKDQSLAQEPTAQPKGNSTPHYILRQAPRHNTPSFLGFFNSDPSSYQKDIIFFFSIRRKKMQHHWNAFTGYKRQTPVFPAHALNSRRQSTCWKDIWGGPGTPLEPNEQDNPRGKQTERLEKAH